MPGPLGETLISLGVITPDQLDTALDRQRGSGALIGDVLRGLGMVSEEQLARALAAEADSPFVDLTNVTPSSAAVRLVPEPLARRHLLAPVGFEEGVLRVAQANPFDVLALDELERRSGVPVKGVCAAQSQVTLLIERAYRPRPASVDARGNFLSQARRSTPAPSRALSRPSQALQTPARPPGSTDRPAPSSRAVAAARSPLADLDLAPVTSERLGKLLDATTGVILIEGPKGAGKSTLLRAALAETPREARGVDGLSDRESARRALEAGVAGAQVVACIETRGQADGLFRLLDMGIDPELVATGLSAILSVRLLRTICPDCRVVAPLAHETLARVGLGADAGVLFFRGRGCPGCRGTGYKGASLALEILPVGSATRTAIRRWTDPRSFRAATRPDVLRSLEDDVLRKALFGQTTLEQVVAALA